MTSRQAIEAFIACINAHDVDGLGRLMSADHDFIDSHGNEVSGREKMIVGWRGYFEWFPDYWIKVNEIFEGELTENGQRFALTGFAGGSFKGNSELRWRLPAAWKAIVKDGGIARWQVYADTKIPLEIIQRGSK